MMNETLKISTKRGRPKKETGITMTDFDSTSINDSYATTAPQSQMTIRKPIDVEEGTKRRRRDGN